MSVNPDSSRASRRCSPEIVAAIVVLLTGDEKTDVVLIGNGPLEPYPRMGDCRSTRLPRPG